MEDHDKQKEQCMKTSFTLDIGCQNLQNPRIQLNTLS